MAPYLAHFLSHPEFRLNWLVSAEVNRTPAAPRKSAVSFFFEHPAEWAAFRRIMELPEKAITQEDQLRSDFDFVPRRWVKLHYNGADWVGISQYLVINPGVNYPITSLRVALRRCGAPDVRFIERAFQPALQSEDSLWAVILKQEDIKKDVVARPRLSCYVDRAIVPGILDTLVKSEWLSAELGARYQDMNERIVAGDQIYLSLDLLEKNAVSLDFEDVVPGSVPPEIRPDMPRYLKCRFLPGRPEPVWSWYAPLITSLSAAERENILAWRHGANNTATLTNEAKEYYNRYADAIIGTATGSTYQAGLLKDKNAAETNAEWARRAGISPEESVLDLGCGAGGPAIDICRAVPGVVIDGITVSQQQANHANRLIQEANLANRIRIHVADYHTLPFGDGTFDRVLFLESIGYASDYERLFREVARVLRPGGTLFIKDTVVSNESGGSENGEAVLSFAESLELAEFDFVYAQQTPTPSVITAAIKKAGFIDITYQDITSEVSTEQFNTAMFARNNEVSALASMGLGGGQLTLPDKPTPFGERHFRHYQSLPVRFAILTARLLPSG